MANTTPTPSEARQVALLPCPFCGGVPAIGPWKEAIDQSNTAPTAIECSSDLHDCPVNPSVAHWTREDAVAAWNRRALRQGGEAVAWQCRHRSSEPHEPWWNVPRETYEAQRNAALWSDMFEYRALYALPPPPTEGEAA